MAYLINLLPENYAESNETVAIQEGIQVESEALKMASQDLLNQLFVETATWGLSNWEKYLGLTLVS